ncbi:MAG TPA: serine hydrolase [Chitinophagaceae bacterium]|nr:serine hydrolase [Chitinophagaceae bacterium]
MASKNIGLFLLYLFFFVSCNQGEKHEATNTEDGIRIASMTDAGMDSSVLNRIDTAITNGTYPNIHSLLIARNNELVYEKYWPGKDQSWGIDLGVRQHSKDSLHDIRSISKSVVSACIGIAIQQGKIKNVEQKVFDFFPEYSKLDTGLISSLTIKHLLTMSSGLKWNEEVPYDNPENSEIKMTRSSNVVEYVLSQPMDFPPGKVWKYNGGTTQLLAAIVEKTTGKKVDQFANEYLFRPLGIEKFEWIKYPGTDMPAAASALRLTARDLLKFGLLYHNNGKWNDKNILPAKWIEESFQSYVQRPGGGGYGYQFWTWNDTLNTRPIAFVACIGNGDQRIFFDNAHDLVIVTNAGNYNKWDIEKDAYALIRDHVYPAIRK